MNEINIYPRLRVACRSEARFKAVIAESCARVSNPNQLASELDVRIASKDELIGNALRVALKAATRDVHKVARAELPHRFHRWLDHTPYFPRIITYRIVADLGGQLALSRGPRSLRQLCGVFPQNGKAVRKVRGQKLTYNPLCKTALLSPKQNGLVTQIVMKSVVPFVEYYREHKEYLRKRDDPPREDWWIDNTARRFTAQKVLNELWEVEHLGEPRRWSNGNGRPE